MEEKKNIDANDVSNEDEVTTTSNGDSKQETEGDATQDKENTAVSLPPISIGDTQAVILMKGDIKIVAMMETNQNTLITEGITVTAIKNNVPCISARKPMSFTKKEILNSKDFSVMKKLYNFDLNEIGIDDLKTAYERIKEFLQNGSSVESTTTTVNIFDLYREIMDRVMVGCKQNVLGMPNKMINIKGISKSVPAFKEIQGSYGVHTVELADILYGTGYSQDSFCRALYKASELMGISPLIVKESNGRWAKTLDDGRYYVFRQDKELCKNKN